MRFTLALLPFSLIAAVAIVHSTTATNAESPAPSSEPKSIPVPSGPVLKSTVLNGGLFIEDLKLGAGAELRPDQAFSANYHCTIKATGRPFDSSYHAVFRHQGPAAFSPSLLIEGWRRGMLGMKIGGIRRMTIPAALGYGDTGALPMIPPSADLVFTIELTGALDVENIAIGTGDAFTTQCVAVTTFTVRDAGGKEIDKADAARPAIWLPFEYPPIRFGLEGMRVGGKRKLIVPADMNTLSPGSTSAHPATQRIPITIEVELLGVRKLPPRSGGGGC